jgi:MFS family permease
LGANWRQFSLLVLINGFVGAMVGQERALLPLLAEHEFGLTSRALILSFVCSFGLAKALANLFAGHGSDRLGRKKLLIAGWLVAIPIPLLLMWAPTWEWIILANVLLGLNQGLCWSTTVIMKIDIVGPAHRGLAMGLNEAAGYVAVSLAAFVSASIAASTALRPQPFILGIGFVLAGLLLSWVFVQESRGHAHQEAALLTAASGRVGPQPRLSFRAILGRTSWGIDRCSRPARPGSSTT